MMDCLPRIKNTFVHFDLAPSPVEQFPRSQSAPAALFSASSPQLGSSADYAATSSDTYGWSADSTCTSGTGTQLDGSVGQPHDTQLDGSVDRYSTCTSGTDTQLDDIYGSIADCYASPMYLPFLDTSGALELPFLGLCSPALIGNWLSTADAIFRSAPCSSTEMPAPQCAPGSSTDVPTHVRETHTAKHHKQRLKNAKMKRSADLVMVNEELERELNIHKLAMSDDLDRQQYDIDLDKVLDGSIGNLGSDDMDLLEEFVCTHQRNSDLVFWLWQDTDGDWALILRSLHKLQNYKV